MPNAPEGNINAVGMYSKSPGYPSRQDLRVLPSRALPLPRIGPDSPPNALDHREVVVVGAGPSGLFLTLLLARYGITGSSLLCLDSKPGTLKAGQADGLQPRTLEVFQSLGIAGEILREGCHMTEVAFWNPIASTDSQRTGIERTAFVPDVAVPARYSHEVTIHQGRIERILQEDLHLYASQDVIRRSHHFTDYEIDHENHPEYPILVKYDYELENGTLTQGSVRTKYLVGADGAHSKVRKSMGLELEGETSDHIWGVCDFIADTDFPDIRNRCAVHSSSGSVMIIPRERIATDEYLTRLYVHAPESLRSEAEDDVEHETSTKKSGRTRRQALTLEQIFKQAQAVFAPYQIKIKENTKPDWWAAYQIGQRMSPRFTKRAPDGVDRMFIIGDACHTHSPKAGQGMNVSMMDAYNLSWKLAHSILGLTPHKTKSQPDPVLETFDQERVDTARLLIEFDKKFSHMFSGQIGAQDSSAQGMSQAEFQSVFSQGSGFTSGCGLHYRPSTIVDDVGAAGPIESFATDSQSTHLTAGRRLLNVELKRYADGSIRQLHDEIGSSGRYTLLLLLNNDLLDASGSSQAALRSTEAILSRYPQDVIDLIVIHPLQQRFEWTDIPRSVKRLAEMRTYGVAKREDAYELYGVSKDKGAVIVVRPDGYVGTIGHLESCRIVEAYFQRNLREI